MGNKTIYNKEDLRAIELELDDKVVFKVGDETLNYTVNSKHVGYDGSYCNYRIFNVLGLDKKKFCNKLYGYESGDGDWPTYKEKDFEVAKKVIEELYSVIDLRKHNVKELNGFKIGSKVKLLIRGSVYADYQLLADTLSLKNYVIDFRPEEGTEGTIVGINVSQSVILGRYVIAVKLECGKEILVHENGLEKIEEVTKKEEECTQVKNRSILQYDVKYKRSEISHLLRVGDRIETKAYNGIISGEIGEIDDSYFYIWQDTHSGSNGKLHPDSKGYKFSWAIDKTYNEKWIIIRKLTTEKVEDTPAVGKIVFENGSIISMDELKYGVKYKVSDISHLLKVGDIVETEILGDIVTGEIGEVDNGSIYLWQNEHDGDWGKLKPKSKEYKYSWWILKSNDRYITVKKDKEITKEEFKCEFLEEPVCKNLFLCNEKYKINEIANSLKVGDKVETNGNCDIVSEKITEGMIGEISDDRIFIWQNEHNGSRGVIKPETKGYKYSWQIYKDNKDAYIIVKDYLPKLGSTVKPNDTMKGGKSDMRIYRIVIVDRRTNDIVLNETITAPSSQTASMKVVLENADKLKKKNFDELEVVVNDINDSSYDPIKETVCVLKECKK